jgi:hypothetical protein
VYISAAVKNTAIDGYELKENMLRAFVYVFFILTMSG